MGYPTTAVSCTPKPRMRTYIIEAMNDIRALGNEPGFASVGRWIESKGVLTPGDLAENPSATASSGFAYVWQTTLSFVASEMKANGELIREHYTPWMLTAWGIDQVQFAKEIHARTRPQLTTCSKCWTQHRPEVECW